MYLIIFFLSSLFMLYSEKKQNRFIKIILVWFSLLIPSIFAGLRDYTLGNDVLLYGNYWFEKAVSYNSLYEYLIKANEYGIGIGYAFLNYMVSRISSSPHIFYFIYELLLMIILYWAIVPYKKNINIAYAYLIFLFSYYNSSFNILRQIGAIILVLFALQFVIKKNIIAFMLIIAIACTFHSSAIIAVVIYPCYQAINSKFKDVYKGLIVGGVIICVLGIENIFNAFDSINLFNLSRYKHYFTDTDIGGRFLRLIYWGIVFAIVIINKKKIYMIEKGKYAILVWMCYFSLVLSVLSFIVSTWATRIAFYFDISQIITLPIIERLFSIKIGKKRMTGVVLILLPFMYWVITFVVRNGGETYPYIFMQS